MQTEMGTGQTTVIDFAVDFGDTHTYIGGKSYPKGYFANAVLNIGKEEMTQLLVVTAPIFHALQDIVEYGYSVERFERGRMAVLELKELLFRMEPFCLLDLETEQERLDFLLSDEVRQFLQKHWELLQRKDADGGIMRIQLSEEEADINNKGLALLQVYTDLLKPFMQKWNSLWGKSEKSNAPPR